MEQKKNLLTNETLYTFLPFSSLLLTFYQLCVFSVSNTKVTAVQEVPSI